MTICLGVKLLDSEGKVKVKVASDSAVSFGSGEMKGISKSCVKVLEFPGACIACSGSGVVFEALAILQEDEEYMKRVQFRNRTDIRNFARDLFEQYKCLVEESVCGNDDASMGTVIIGTEDNLYSVFGDLSVFEHDFFNYSGSGGSTANALMYLCYDELAPDSTEEELEAVINKVLLKTCELENGCAPPIKIYTPSGANPPLVKKTKKKKLTTSEDSSKISSEGVTKNANNKRRNK